MGQGVDQLIEGDRWHAFRDAAPPFLSSPWKRGFLAMKLLPDAERKDRAEVPTYRGSKNGESGTTRSTLIAPPAHLISPAW